MELDGGSCEKNMSAKMSRNTLEKSIFISRERNRENKERKIKTFHFLDLMLFLWAAFQIVFDTHKTVISVWQVVYIYYITTI